MSGHTPGPWRIVIDGTCSAAWPHIVPSDYDCDSGDEELASLRTCFLEKKARGMPGSYSEKPNRFRKTPDHDQVMADARLIAAAPELLEALKSIVDDYEFCKAHPAWGDRSESYAESARLAIAAATGENA